MTADRKAASRPPGRMLLDMRLFARPDQLKAVRSAVRDAAIGAGCSDECADEVVIALNEACMNVMEHGYRLDPNGEMTLQLAVKDGMLVAWLGDQCAPIDAADLKSRELDDLRPGGLGVHFMRQCMDEVTCLAPPAGFGNLLQMTKAIS